MNFVHKIFKTLFCLLCAFCIFVLSCDIDIFSDDSLVLASVGNRSLHVSELRDLAQENEFTKEEWVTFIETWIDHEVLYQEALSRGMQKDKEMQKLIKNAEKKILADRVRQDFVRSIPQVSYEDERNFYDSNLDLFRDDSLIIEFEEVKEKIKKILTVEKIKQEEKQQLQKIKNNYNIKIRKEYLDSL